VKVVVNGPDDDASVFLTVIPAKAESSVFALLAKTKGTG
jgi:hypothetical protein